MLQTYEGYQPSETITYNYSHSAIKNRSLLLLAKTIIRMTSCHSVASCGEPATTLLSIFINHMQNK